MCSEVDQAKDEVTWPPLYFAECIPFADNRANVFNDLAAFDTARCRIPFGINDLEAHCVVVVAQSRRIDPTGCSESLSESDLSCLV